MMHVRIRTVMAELVDFRMRWTYEGYLAGKRDRVSQCIRGMLIDDLRALMGACDAIEVLDDGRPELPEYMCLAYLRSNKVPGTDADFSHLLLCWFTDEVKAAPTALVADVAGNLDWERLAAPGAY